MEYLTYKKHFDEDPGDRLGIFATGPAIKSYGWNLLTEIIGTFVLIGWIIVTILCLLVNFLITNYILKRHLNLQ